MAPGFINHLTAVFVDGWKESDLAELEGPRGKTLLLIGELAAASIESSLMRLDLAMLALNIRFQSFVSAAF
jgi:hypothetical protein